VSSTPARRRFAGDDERQATQRHRAILEAAAIVFLRSGYLGASMDQVAAHAGVSKQTVYKHFEDKQHLFSEVVTRTVDEAGEPTVNEVMNLRDTGNLEADLCDLGRRLLTRVMQPRLLQLRRLVIGEAGRFPELGLVFYERGPARTLAALSQVFGQLATRGLLTLDDPALAAEHFNWLVMSAPLNRAMFLGRDDPLSSAEIDRFSESGVRVFIARYGNEPPPKRSRQDRRLDV
jgi:TetR/AcrR family transcriptional regulator, mexJK operon transcriptional repressor